MKKSLFILSLLCFSVMAFAQQMETEEEVKGAHPYNIEENENVSQEFAHWSIIPEVGFSGVDGDFTNELLHNIAVPTIGLAAEYNFTPVWNIGAEFMYDMYTVTGRPGNADTLLNGHMMRLGGYLSLDLVNLFFPRAQKKIVSVIPHVGGGIALYKRNKYYMDDMYVDAATGITHNPTHGRGNTLNYINADGVVGPEHDKSYNSLGYIMGGVTVDFNLNRTLALGVRANYDYFTRDYMDGRGYHKHSTSSYASKNNDGMFEVTLNLRVKLMGVSQTHVRNIASFDTWEPEPEPCYVHDTVIIKHDSVVIRESTHRQSRQRDMIQRIYYVYFDNAKHNLDDKALITIQQLADVMQEDTTLYAVVVGYCDNTGSNSLNFSLGDRRAASVMNELQTEHEIKPEHMYGMGLGKLVGNRSKAGYAPNRRAVIRLVDKRTFLRMQRELEEKRDAIIRAHGHEDIEEGANQGGDTIGNEVSGNSGKPEKVTVPLSESARPVKVNEYKERKSEKVVSESGMTLSKLARKYYNNTYCWVYIYIANKEKIPNPNAVLSGIELTIPELTQEEMSITKDQSLVLYGNARQEK